jgi:DNA replication protein DnaC
MDVSSATEATCPYCKGAGFVYKGRVRDDPDFGKAVPCQCTRQALEAGRRQLLERYSNLGPLIRLTFDNLVPQGRRPHASNQGHFCAAVEAARAFARSPDGWLVLLGPSGCGKTHLAASIVNYRLSQGQPALFVVVPDLLDHLRSCYDPQSTVSYDELFDQMRQAPLLILDDLGMQTSTPWAREKLDQLISHRFNSRLPTVFTCAVVLEELEERLRSRLSDTELSRVFVLEESKPPPLSQLSSLGLEMLSEMTFESFDVRRLGLTPEERKNLQEAHRIAQVFAQSPEGSWLVLYGKNGCGKTHLAAAVANYRLAQGQPAFFVVVPDLLDHFRSAYSPESKVAYDELFETVRSTPLLILDDLGSQTSTPWAQEKLYQLVNYRYNARLATVITTSLTSEQIEPRLKSRMTDGRLSTTFLILAPDYRLDQEQRPAFRNPSPRRHRAS